MLVLELDRLVKMAHLSPRLTKLGFDPIRNLGIAFDHLAVIQCRMVRHTRVARDSGRQRGCTTLSGCARYSRRNIKEKLQVACLGRTGPIMVAVGMEIINSLDVGQCDYILQYALLSDARGNDSCNPALVQFNPIQFKPEQESHGLAAAYL